MAQNLATELGLTSPAFRSGDEIPSRYTCDGENVSPPLSWDPAPKQTKSLVLIVEDPDTPNRIWSHWVVVNMPPNATHLPEAMPAMDMLEDGTRQGLNDFGHLGYGGPSSPEARHHYVFRLFAVNALLLIPPRFSRSEVLRAMQGRVLSESRLVGLHRRRAVAG